MYSIVPKNFHSLSLIFLSIYVYSDVTTNTHLCACIFLCINAFCALMCSLSVQMFPKVYNSLWKQRKDKKKKMIKDKRTKRWNKHKGKRTSGAWDLSEKRRERESRSRKNGVLRENQKSKTHLWLLACVSIDWEPARLTESDMQTEEDFPMSKGGQKKNRENPSGQKLSHLYFVQRSLCRTMPNKEGTTVITLFLPPGFPRESTHKTRQPGLSRFDPRGVRSHLRILKTCPGAHFSRFGEVWPKLIKFDQGLDQTKSKIWLTNLWPLDRVYRELWFDTL